MEEITKAAKVVIVLGPGGVGKTTSSLALAISEAKSGKKVALLSIDPAKRLADALGIPLDTHPKPIKFPSEFELRGNLDAAMIDQKAIFDQMVDKFVKKPELKQRIFNHPLYLALSTNLAGPLEYLSLTKLHELATSGNYDTIFLDTPPDSQALDFLARPNLLAGFMEKRIIHWLIKPFHLASNLGVSKLLSLGERLMGGVAKIAGFETLKMLAEFIVLMQKVIEGFHETGQEVINLLKSDETKFILITKPSFDSTYNTHAALVDYLAR